MTRLTRMAFVVLPVALTGIFSEARSALKDDVLGLTGNVRAKMVWVRAARGSTGFSTTPSCYYNGGTGTSLMAYDSYEDNARTLDAGPAQHISPIITRSGNYVIWNDIQNNKSVIVNWDGTGKKNLISGSGSRSYVLCTQWDATIQKEYLYTTDAVGAGTPVNIEEAFYKVVYKMEFTNSTATVNTSGAVKVLDLSSENDPCRAPMLVSGDGKAAGINNWPWMFIQDFSSGEPVSINTGGDMACWANMAPDASHRFFHFNAEHTSLHMFDTYNTTVSSQIRFVNINSKLPGNTWFDCNGPRFSNDTRYISVSYPLVADESYQAGEFCIGKFNAGFTDATFVRITPTGDTNRDRIGDLWVASGEGPNKTDISPKASARFQKTSFYGVDVTSHGISVSFLAGGPYRASLISAAGRTVATHAGSGPHTWEIASGSVDAGTYIVSVVTQGQQFCRKVTIGR